MAIEWNTVTWYSKFAAVILFVAVFILAFYLGMEYQRALGVAVPAPSADETPIEEQTLDVPADMTLRLGETKKAEDLSLTFNALVQDNRCAVDEECMEGGAITANVTFSRDGLTESKNMPSDEVPQEFGGYAISIGSVEPVRMSGEEIDPADYRVTFHVEAL